MITYLSMCGGYSSAYEISEQPHVEVTQLQKLDVPSSDQFHQPYFKTRHSLQTAKLRYGYSRIVIIINVEDFSASKPY